MVEQIPDEQLMARVQQGQTQWFGELVRRFRPGLVRTALGRLGQRWLAEDVTQETLMAAFKSRATYNPQYSFRTWLWTILFNQCRTVWSRQRRRPQVHTGWGHEPASAGERAHPASSEPPPDAGLVSAERQELVERLLATLSPVQADALRLRFYAGMKFQEIADTMGCSLGTAKNRVRWGLERLAVHLDEQPTGVEVGE